MSKQSNNIKTEDVAIEEIFAHYVDRMMAGETIDLEQIKERHPEVGDEIVEELRQFSEIVSDDDTRPTVHSFGDCDIVREIGRGGMGVVYEAWQTTLQRHVAVKILSSVTRADPKSVARFVREAQVAAKLNHPNIVSVYGMGMEDRIPYFTMECIDGVNLRYIVRHLRQLNCQPAICFDSLLNAANACGDGQTAKQNPNRPSAISKTEFGNSELTLKYCLDVAVAFAQVADGLQHAHDKRVVHRDIKPSNLIFQFPDNESTSNEGRLRILDFGLAQGDATETLTLSGDIVGTPAYMSPEQAENRRQAKVDHRTDIYSLGATLYELVTLEPPFEGRNHQDTIRKIAHDEPKLPRNINSRIPKDLETIICKCMRKTASDRYGTAEAVAQDLRRFVRGDPIEARPPSMLEIFGRRLWLARWRVAFAILLLILVVSTIFFSWSAREGRRIQQEIAYREQIRMALRELRIAQLGGHESSQYDIGIYPWGFSLFPFQGSGRSMDSRPHLEKPIESARSRLVAATEALPDRADAYWQLARVRFMTG
ncbi:MAG: serine/threonine protein kinase, partial [Planctomycetales bacterium]|nr:serine/threonine protein kinase [Planctomycetales bacterium]